jgi:hypothetical protein
MVVVVEEVEGARFFSAKAKWRAKGSGHSADWGGGY